MHEALALDPDDAQGHSALLLEMQYDNKASSRGELSRAHWEWADRHLRGVRKVVAHAPSRRIVTTSMPKGRNFR